MTRAQDICLCLYFLLLKINQKSQIVKTKALEEKPIKMTHDMIILQKYKEVPTIGPILSCRT